jgi:serine/threonine-protein kinase HipA
MGARVVSMKKRILHILMNGICVGKLEKSAQGGLHFAYEHTWLNTPGARPISLSLPLIKQSFIGDVVYNFFDNLLPDSTHIRGRIQTKFHANTNHPFDLLTSIGRDCVGAIQIIEDTIPAFKQSIQYKTLDESKIAAILRSYQSNPLGMTDDFEDFRISIAGAQEKTAFLYYKNQWHIPLAETPTTHIFKLPIGFIQHQQLDLSDSCENEWLCSQIAHAFGFNVANCHIECFEDIKALVVERFDRKLSVDQTWIMRLPQEDMCQALGLSSHLKYQSEGGPGIIDIMNLLLGSEEPLLDRDIFFRTQILFCLLCAIDGHAKNFSLFIEPDGKYRLTPLYDIMSASPLIDSKQLSAQKVKMAMALKGKNTHYRWYELKRTHFIDTAKKVGYSPQKANIMLDEMLAHVDTVIKTVSNKIPPRFPEKIAISIFQGIRFMQHRLSNISY